MSNKNAVFLFIALSLACTFAIEARAGATISDRRYWPNEARSSPGSVIEIYPPSYAYQNSAGNLADPRPIVSRKKTKRLR